MAGDEVLQVYVAADAASLAAPQPPYVPVLESDGDLKHFSREFTGKSLSPADAKSLGEVRDYEGWDYADGDFEVKFD